MFSGYGGKYVLDGEVYTFADYVIVLPDGVQLLAFAAGDEPVPDVQLSGYADGTSIGHLDVANIVANTAMQAPVRKLSRAGGGTQERNAPGTLAGDTYRERQREYNRRYRARQRGEE